LRYFKTSTVGKYAFYDLPHYYNTWLLGGNL
jgi:hypothetical protein